MSKEKWDNCRIPRESSIYPYSRFCLHAECHGRLRILYMRDESPKGRNWVNIGFICQKCGLTDVHMESLPKLHYEVDVDRNKALKKRFYA